MVGVTVLFTAVLVGGGVYGWQSYEKEKLREKLQNEINHHQQEVGRLQNEKEKWNIYKNEKYGYSIKYPKGWPLYSDNLEEVIFGNVPFEPSPGPLAIVVHANKNILYINEFENYFPEGCTEQEETLVGNLRARRLTCVNSFSGEDMEYYFIERDESLYEIGYILGSQELNLIFETMIKSFSFERSELKESTEIGKVDAWKSCINDEYGYQAKYPDNWAIYAQEDWHTNEIFSSTCNHEHIVLSSSPFLKADGAMYIEVISFEDMSAHPHYANTLDDFLSDAATDESIVVKEIILDGERALWYEDYDILTYHNGIPFEISGINVIQELFEIFLSSFEFLD